MANDDWPPIHPTSIHWIIRFRGNAGVSSQAANKDKNNSRDLRCTAADFVCLIPEEATESAVKDFCKATAA